MPINLEEESRALDQLPEALGESDGVFGREHRLCCVRRERRAGRDADAAPYQVITLGQDSRRRKLRTLTT